MNKKKFLLELINNCKGRGYKIAFPESSDIRILKAAKFLITQKVVDKVTFFSKDSILKTHKDDSVLDYFSQYSSHIDFCEDTYPSLKEEITHFLKDSKKDAKKKLNHEQITYCSDLDLYKSIFLLKKNRVDCVLAGCRYPTSDVIRGGLRLLDLSPHNKTLSSSFIMFREASSHFDSFFALFADCGVVIDPSCEQIQDIAEQTLKSLKILKSMPLFSDIEPILAFLSFSTKGSASHSRVDKISQAFEGFKKKHPKIKCEGEMQFDAAFVTSVRKQKVTNSILGSLVPNVYIFPSLEAGNISYKVAQHLGNCMALGPILQGFKGALCDLSRGASVEDIIFLSCINLIKSEYEK